VDIIERVTAAQLKWPMGHFNLLPFGPKLKGKVRNASQIRHLSPFISCVLYGCFSSYFFSFACFLVWV